MKSLKTLLLLITLATASINNANAQQQFNTYYMLGSFWGPYINLRPTLPTIEGGYLTLGITGAVNWGSLSALMVKQDAEGNTQWIKEFEINSGLFNEFDLDETDEGDIIFTNYNIISKLNISGDIVWCKAYSDFPHSLFFKRTIVEPSGELNLLGWSELGVILMKLDESGDIMQQALVTSTEFQFWSYSTMGFVKSENGDFFVTLNHEVSNFGDTEDIIIKFNPDFSIAWVRKIENTGFIFDDILIKPNGNILQTGYFSVPPSYDKFPVISELDGSTGEMVWTKMYLLYPGTGNSFGPSNFILDNDTIIGCSSSGNLAYSFGTLIFKTDDNGNFISVNRIDREEYVERGNCICKTGYDSYIVNGYWEGFLNQGFFVMDISKEGFAACYNSEYNLYDSTIILNTVSVDPSVFDMQPGNFIETEISYAGVDGLVEGIYDGCIFTNTNTVVTNEQSLKISPNPNNGKFNVEIHSGHDGQLIISSLMGTRIYTMPVSGSDSNVISLDLNIPPGIYFVEFRGKEVSIVKKMLVN